MVHVLMLVTNPVDPDPRVEREAESLNSYGFKVHIVGMAHDRTNTSVTTISQKLKITRLRAARISFGLATGWIRALLKLVSFNLQCFRKLPNLIKGISIIHSNDLDTLPIGYLMAKISGTKLVYDVHEVYSGMFAESVPSIIGTFVDSIERFLSRKADLILTTGTLMGQRMDSLSGKKSIRLRNAPFRNFGDGVQRVEPTQFVVGYIGGLLEDRNLVELVEAFKAFYRVQSNSSLVIAGWGALAEYSREAALESNGSIRYLGKIPKSEVANHFASFSISIVFTTKKKINHLYASANKIFESASVGVPVLATDYGELAWVVKTYDIGFVVDSDNTNSIEMVLNNIFEGKAELSIKGARARRLFEDKFCWDHIEHVLVESYLELLHR